MTDIRHWSDRHGPLAWYCVTVIAVLCAYHPAAIPIGIGAIGTLYAARAAERGWRAARDQKSRIRNQ